VPKAVSLPTIATLLGKASASRLSEVPREEELPRPEGSADRADREADPEAERDAEAEADRDDREEDIFWYYSQFHSRL
jgi:hypothetical protein